MHIAIAQINLCVGAIHDNSDKIIACLNDAKKQHVDLIIFPELSLSGYPPEDLLFRRAFHEQIDPALQSVISASGDIALILGYPRKEDNQLFNSCAYIKNGTVLATYDKQILPNYGVFDEKRYFTAGNKPCIIDLEGLPAALSICEDLWAAGPAKEASENGAEILININASPFHSSKQAEREKIIKQRCNETGMQIVYANLVGGQDELVFDGGSLLCASNGDIIAQGSHFTEDVFYFELQNKKLKPLPGFDSSTPLPYLDSIYNALVLGVRDYVRKNGFKGAVIGLSGGIDSALTLAIAVDALGAENVEVLIMPSRYTAEMSNEDAVEMARGLDVHFNTIPIEEPFTTFTDLLGPVFKDLPADTTEENIQARCRGVLMMAVSNKTGKLVLTTGNKSEMSVGYATLYGDMAGGFAPLKDLSKTLTYELSRWRNSGTVVIPQRIIDRPPSAELRPDQKDEDSLPPYDLLDTILENYIEKDMSPSDIVALGFDPAIVNDVCRMVDINEYKRRQAAPGVRITKRAFGRDRRYPITSGYREN